MTMRQQLIETGLFTETDTRDLVREHVCDEVQEFSGEPIKVGYKVRLKFNAFGELVDCYAMRFDPVMREIVAANRKAAMHSKPEGA